MNVWETEPNIVRKYKGSIVFEWVLAEGLVCEYCGIERNHDEHAANYPHEFQGAQTKVIACLNVLSHCPDRKMYTASLAVEAEKSSDRGYKTRSFFIGRGLKILQEEALRFNAKKFEAFAENALMYMRQDAASNEMVASFFASKADVRV